jgi:hypothetical protein
MAKPKLALIPAAQGDKFYSVLPSDGVGDFDFTRNSSATRIAPTGFIETSELFGSELVTNGDFATDSDWTKGTGWSIANGVAALDGTQTTGSGLGSTTISVVSGKRYKIVVNVLSSSSGFRLYDSYGVIAYGLSLGVNVFYITASSSTYQITPLGLSGTTGSIDNVSVKEQIGKSRLNYDLLNGKVVNCPHYLLEPARTNTITYSNTISQWTNSDNTTLPNVITSPDGNLNGGKVIVNNGATAANIRPMASVSSTSGLDYVFSVFVKAGEFDKINLDFSNAVFGSAGATFDLTSGIVIGFDGVNVSQGIEDYGNGWYRCYLVATAIATGSGALILRLDDNGTGDGVKGLYVYGAQFEQGSYPTSYIPTNGTAITRAAETADGSGDAATFNDSEGVLMAETSALDSESTNKMITISNGSSSTRILIRYVGTTLLAQLRISGANQYEFSYNPTNIKDNFKIALKYKANDFSFFVNGFELDSSNSGSTFSDGTLTELAFDDGGGANDFYGKTRELQYFDSVLTDSQLETLTSWTSLQEMITSQLYTNY